MQKEDFFEVAYSVETEDETREMYDRWSEVYDRDLSATGYRQPARCAEALEEVMSSKDITVLDVGCGTGLSGMALKAAGFKRIDGCDLSEGMLEKAGKLGIYNRLFVTNLNEPPIEAEDQQYDAVTAVGVFSFGHVKASAVRELLRITKHRAPIIIGLNDHFYEEGSLISELETLQSHGKLEIIAREHGDHIPGNDLKGWVLTMRKC